MGYRGPRVQMHIPFTGVVKKLVIINVAIWVGLQVILEGLILRSSVITQIFGLSTSNVITNFFLWEPFTYMFLHSSSIFHILFNMLLLWWLGSELEAKWGSRFFLIYYLVSGAGAGVIYLLTKTLYSVLFLQRLPIDGAVVVGASGAVYGLMLAYGILFGERIMYFMFIFPMKAKWMITLLGGIQLISLLQTGIDGGGVSNLAHLGGIVAGYLFLISYTRYMRGPRKRKPQKKNRRQLKLVVSNDDENPKYWN